MRRCETQPLYAINHLAMLLHRFSRDRCLKPLGQASQTQGL